jgi:hypothetical protein
MLLRHQRFLILVVVSIVAALMIAPSVALAQDQLANPSSAQYEPSIPEQGTAGAVGGGGPSDGGSAANEANGSGDNVGSLPFTGMDLMIVAGVALVLTGTGLALHRLSTPPRRG